MAFDVRKLVIAAVGLLLIQIGWVALDRAMPASAAATPEPFGSPEILGFPHQRSIGQNTIALTMRLSEPIRLLTTPLLALLDPASDAMMMIHAMLGLIWLILVWGICGGAIARLATIQEAQMRQPGILEGLRFARQSSTWLIVAPLCPLLGIGFCSLLGAGFGLLYRVPHGAILAGILLVFPILAGLLMAMLAAGLVAGWPLMHAAVAAGSDDALDALSRTFSYLNQRLGLYVVGVAVAWLSGLLGLIAVDLLTAGVVRMTLWSLSLTGGESLPSAMFQQVPPDTGAAAYAAHHFWLASISLLAHAWPYSFFSTSGAILYLWLRREVDGTPDTEIDPPAQPIRPTAVQTAEIPTPQIESVPT